LRARTIDIAGDKSRRCGNQWKVMIALVTLAALAGAPSVTVADEGPLGAYVGEQIESILGWEVSPTPPIGADRHLTVHLDELGAGRLVVSIRDRDGLLAMRDWVLEDMSAPRARIWMFVRSTLERAAVCPGCDRAATSSTAAHRHIAGRPPGPEHRSSRGPGRAAVAGTGPSSAANPGLANGGAAPDGASATRSVAAGAQPSPVDDRALRDGAAATGRQPGLPEARAASDGVAATGTQPGLSEARAASDGAAATVEQPGLPEARAASAGAAATVEQPGLPEARAASDGAGATVAVTPPPGAPADPRPRLEAPPEVPTARGAATSDAHEARIARAVAPVFDGLDWIIGVGTVGVADTGSGVSVGPVLVGRVAFDSPLRLAAELGYRSFSGGDSLNVVEVPIAFSAGWHFDWSFPIELGVIGSLTIQVADTPSSTHAAAAVHVGPYARYELDLLDVDAGRWSLYGEGRTTIALVRQRFSGAGEVVEGGPITFAASIGAQWRWY